MAKGRFPPGFRFHPTDVELILYYLKRKVLGKPLAVGAIAEIDLYKYAPWDLPDKSSLFTKDLEWYFFCARENNPRTKRATETGYWKITGKDRTISHKSQVVGLKKTLVYHIGRFPHSTRTNWVMHEYRLNIKEWMHTEIPQDSYVLCKVFEKSGAGPKVGEQHGAPFKEEDWEDELIDASAISSLVFTRNSPSTIVNDDKITVTEGSTHALENSCKFSFQPPCQSSGIKGKGISFSENLDMESIFSILGEGNDLCQSGNVRNQISESFNHECGVDTPPLLGSDDIFGDLEDFNTSQKMDGIDLLDLFSGNCPPLLGDNASGHNYIGDGVGYVELNDFERPMPILGDNASGHNYLGDAIDYVELNDFERPMKYPVGGDGPNDIQYDNFGVDSFGCTLPTNSNNILYDNFGVDSFGFSLLPTNSNVAVDDRLDMVSNDHVGFVLTKNSLPVDEVSLPFFSSKAIYPTSTVGSSGCMLPRNPFVFTNELDVTSNHHIGFGTTKISSMMDGFPFVSSDTVNRSSRVEFSRCMLPKDSGMLADNLDVVSNDHISFGVTSNNLLMGGCSVPFVSSEGIHPTPSVGSVGCELPRNSGVLGNGLDVDSNDHIGFGVVPTNQFQTLSRGEQHRDNVRLQCLLGSILAQFVPAAEYLSTVIAGEGSNGTSLYVNHGDSSLHVKAEVTVCCGCTKDALYGKLEVLSYLCCYGLKFSVSMLDKKAAAFTCSRLCDSVVVDVVWFWFWFWFLFVVELRVLLKNELHECSNKFVVPKINILHVFKLFQFSSSSADAL